eukprot:COSAG01_NODE_1241_length_11085_cov_9.712361_20_plen_77_part_00
MGETRKHRNGVRSQPPHTAVQCSIAVPDDCLAAAEIPSIHSVHTGCGKKPERASRALAYALHHALSIRDDRAMDGW